MKMEVKFKEPLIKVSDLEKYNVEVGILAQDADKKGNRAKGRTIAGLRYFAGGMARYRKGASKATLGAIAGYLDKRYSWRQKAIDSKENEDLRNVMIRLAALFVDDTKSLRKRYLNACRAFVSNIFVRSDLGKNAPSTIKVKGFDRAGIDTGKFVKTIDARFANGKIT